VDVEAKFSEYLQKAGAKPFPKNHAGAVGELAAFLVGQQAYKLCPRLAALAMTDDAETIHEWLPFFTAANCKEGRAVAVLNLVAGLPVHRSAACEALGTIGTKAELPKVKAVAEGDGYNVIKKRVQLYPVRDKCSSAATKIQVRGN